MWTFEGRVNRIENDKPKEEKFTFGFMCETDSGTGDYLQFQSHTFSEKSVSVESEQNKSDLSATSDFSPKSSSENWETRERSISSLAHEARMKGYEGEACHTCQQFTMVRNGSCLKCASCGSTSGCSWTDNYKNSKIISRSF